MGLTHVTTTVRRLAGRGKGYAAEFLVDTGAFHCLAPAKALRKAGIKPEVTEGDTTLYIKGRVPFSYAKFVGGLYAAVAIDAIKIGSSLGEYFANFGRKGVLLRIGDQAFLNPELLQGTMLWQETDRGDCAAWVYKDNDDRIWVRMENVYPAWEVVAVAIGLSAPSFEWMRYDRA